MKKPGAPDPRSRELAAIHMGKKRLGLDDATYRDLLWTVARVRSAKDLDEHGRRAVIEHMRARGFHAAGGARQRPAQDREALVAKIRALLIEAGRADAYADGMARHMFKVEKFTWLEPRQMHKLVAALMYDQKRRQGRE